MNVTSIEIVQTKYKMQRLISKIIVSCGIAKLRRTPIVIDST